jgi:(1->4)-alpha-D-glucan 1-alpha-D-glucosylmutase
MLRFSADARRLAGPTVSGRCKLRRNRCQRCRAAVNPRNPIVPGATYRVQFTKDFTFRDAVRLVDYWDALGITDVYASPFLKARPGSVHGYDVVDQTSINPEIGTEQDLASLHEALATRRMGLLVDIVPNHMCVGTNENVWWNDVLENGRRSRHADTFDIDWHPPKPELRDKVLLPVLGNQYGKVLEDGELKVCESGGALSVTYFDRRFPMGPASYSRVLEGVVGRLRAGHPGDEPAASRLADLGQRAGVLAGHGATASARPSERQGDMKALQKDLRALLEESPVARAAFDDELRAINGHKGDPGSFDRLEELLGRQAYRLSFWRVAAEQINYRRFFEINDLAAIRVEDPRVRDAVHAKTFELVDRGWITGLRVDHVDGLREPRAYLEAISERTRGLYVVVEKILATDERLPRSWATEGTTGYEMLNLVNRLFVARAGEAALRSIYDQVRSVRDSFADVLYASKRLMLQGAMASELAVLARRLDRISEQHRWSRDFTLGTLQHVLGETIACFPVYRTYVAEGDNEVSPQDVTHVRAALSNAKRRNPAVDASAFEFLGDVLMMRDPAGLSEPDRAERRDFVLRFQQLTGPVMAKGLEDTSFYRYFPLLSLNEVGGSPDGMSLSTEEFHRAMEERSRERPAGLSASSTHDTKRGEDARARLNVLSEIPDEWAETLAHLRELAAPLKPRLDGEPAPDGDDELYIYQTLLGAFPFGPVDDGVLADLLPRAQAAVIKALHEAKRRTSWTYPNTQYEEATAAFVARLLDRAGAFFPALETFAARLDRPAQLGALSQLVLKITAPGVPDFFQGTELWTLSMVDPDNRRPVDFAARRDALSALAASKQRPADLARSLLAEPADGRIKLWTTATLLACRRRERELFARGSYLPIQVEGARRENVVAFARRWQQRVAVTVVGRFFTTLPEGFVGQAWGDTSLVIPPELTLDDLTDALTGEVVGISRERLPVADVLGVLPFSVLSG